MGEQKSLFYFGFVLLLSSVVKLKSKFKFTNFEKLRNMHATPTEIHNNNAQWKFAMGPHFGNHWTK